MEVQTLLREPGRAARTDSKTVRSIAFDVPEGTAALALAFDYGPRTSEDPADNAGPVEAAYQKHAARFREIKGEAFAARVREALNVDGRAKLLHNLMNVVLVDPTGRWRGRWDRNPSSDSGDLFVGEHHASRGFVAGPIQPGRWSVAIECHGVFGSPVDYEVRVLARPAPTSDEIARLAAPRGREAPERRRGPGVYFGELHSHTVHSDGKWELFELASRVRASGADFLCLTDHNTTSGLAELAEHELPLTLIPGCELTTFHGHHPIYGLREAVPWHVEGRVLPLSETSPKIRAMGGIVGVAHPFVPGDPLCTGCRMAEDLVPGSFDLIEVWYRRWDSPGSDNEAAYAFWNRLWKAGHRVTAVAARDLHGADQDGPFPGPLPFTGVFADDNTTEAILDGMRRGRVILSGGPILAIELESGNVRAGIGESLCASGAVKARVRFERTGGACELRVFRSGDLAETRAVEGDGELDFAGLADGPGHYRAELWQGELPRAITNHVVLE